MRVVLITTGPSAVLRHLLESGRELCGIVQNVSPRTARSHLRVTAPLRRLARRVRGREEVGLEPVARTVGLPFYLMSNGSDAAFEAWVRAQCPDLIVVCGMVQLLKRNVYSLPELGAINVHPSVLPSYRGPDPIFWTYHDMAPEGGATVHHIDEGSDTGDVIARSRFDIEPGLRRTELIVRSMGELAPRLLDDALDALARGDAPRTPQPRDSPTVYARRVRPVEHRALVDWSSWPLERVWHFLRGTEPVVPALERPQDVPAGSSLVVGEPQPGPALGAPGSIGRDADGLFVAHPSGKIRLSVANS